MDSNDVVKPKPTIDSSPDELVLQMKLMLKYFSGDMNVLEELANDPNPTEGNIIFNNVQQTISVHGSEMLKNWFSQFENDRKSWDATLYSEKARQMLSMLMQCGIIKREEDRVIWNKQTELCYRKMEEIEYGQECEVIDSCWELDGKVFEKGIVKKV